MKKLLLVLFVGLILISSSFSEPVRKEPLVLVIGEFIHGVGNKKLFDETGSLIIKPYDFDRGIEAIAIHGFICRKYGHTFLNGECKFCKLRKL